MQNKTTRCIDAASENCPCWLAETGDCLTCSRLQGKNECDCSWTGVCIYNEFIHNGSKRALPRTEENFKITEKYGIEDTDFTVMKIACSRGFALKCLNPGTHIFIRPAEREKYYDIPLSVLAADHTEGSITVCFRVMSVKTKALNMCETGGDVIVRGPYRNGIIGLDRRISESRILIIASGAGIMPAVFTSNILAAHNSVDIIAGTGVIEKKILRHYITDDRYTGPDDITFREYDDIKLTEQIRQKSYDEIIILGSIHFVETLKPLIRQISNAHISCSNNSIMTCGEGICGACAGTDKNGKTVLRCKCTEFDI